MTSRPQVAGAALSVIVALASPTVAYYEGLRLKTYLDVGGVPTICYGETEGVKLGQTYTKTECARMLNMKLAYEAVRVQQMTPTPLPPATHAALSSFAYNVGLGTLQRSSVLRKLNEGDIAGACDALQLYVYAAGKKQEGLVRRRAAERNLCLEGIRP